MTPPTLFLKDADEIEAFYVETTGMVPSFMQLSAGSVNLVIDVCEPRRCLTRLVKGRRTHVMA